MNKSIKVFLFILIIKLLPAGLHAQEPLTYRYVQLKHYDTTFAAGGGDMQILPGNRVLIGSPWFWRFNVYEAWVLPFQGAIWSNGNLEPIYSGSDYERLGEIRANNSGLMAIGARTPVNSIHIHPAVLLSGGPIQEQELLPKVHPDASTCMTAYATDVNDNGLVVGWERTGDNLFAGIENHLTVWDNGNVQVVPPPGEYQPSDIEFKFDLFINNNGIIAGTVNGRAGNGPSDSRAIYGSQSGWSEVGLGRDSTRRAIVNDLNENGWAIGMTEGAWQVSGTESWIDPQRHAFVCKNGTSLEDLNMSDTANDVWQNIPIAINSEGVIVGNVGASNLSAALWREENGQWVSYALRDLVVEGENIPNNFDGASDISDSGVIAVYHYDNQGGPIPGLLIPIRDIEQHCVNTTGDAPDNNPGDGVCSTDETDIFGQTLCSMRAAIMEANAHAGPDTICFNIPGDPIIIPESDLPPLTEQVLIDGRTQPGTEMVQIDGSATLNSGLTIEAANSEIREISVTGIAGSGLKIQSADSVKVFGCRIGTNADLTDLSGNGGLGIEMNNSNYCKIGDTAAGDYNVIAHNDLDGLSIIACLGVDVRGNKIFDNGWSGIFVNSADSGVYLANRVGADPAGDTTLGNGRDGIRVVNSNFLEIGGFDFVKANIITHNADAGVFIVSGEDNRIIRNRIFDNGGLGVDLEPIGPNANDTLDADEGPNTLLNAPVIDSVGGTGGDTFYGHLIGSPNNTHTIEIYVCNECDPSGFGEGETPIITFNVTTDENGFADFAVDIGPEWQPGQYVTMATIDSDNTSEFSNCGPPATEVQIVDIDDQPIPNTSVRLQIYDQSQKDANDVILDTRVTTNSSGKFSLSDVEINTLPLLNLYSRISLDYQPMNNDPGVSGIELDNVAVDPETGDPRAPFLGALVSGTVKLNRIGFTVDFDADLNFEADQSYENQIAEVTDKAADGVFRVTNGLVRVGKVMVYDRQRLGEFNDIHYIARNDVRRSTFATASSISLRDYYETDPSRYLEIFEASPQLFNVFPHVSLAGIVTARKALQQMISDVLGHTFGCCDIPNNTDLPINCDEAVPFAGEPAIVYRGLMHNQDWQDYFTEEQLNQKITSDLDFSDPTSKRALDYALSCRTQWTSLEMNLAKVLSGDGRFHSNLNDYIFAGTGYADTLPKSGWGWLYGQQQPTIEYDKPLPIASPRLSLKFKKTLDLPAVNIHTYLEEDEGDFIDMGRSNRDGMIMLRGGNIGDKFTAFNFGIGALPGSSCYFGKGTIEEADSVSGEKESILDEFNQSDVQDVVFKNLFNAAGEHIVRLSTADLNVISVILGASIQSESMKPTEIILNQINESILEGIIENVSDHYFDIILDYKPLAADPNYIAKALLGLTRSGNPPGNSPDDVARDTYSRDGMMMFVQLQKTFKSLDDDIWILSSPLPIDRGGLSNDMVQLTQVHSIASSTNDTTSGIVSLQYTQTDLEALGLSNDHEQDVKIYGRLTDDVDWAEIPSTVDTVANVVSAKVQPGVSLAAFLVNVITAVDDEHPNALPLRIELAQNYPNPFNPSTTILYSLPKRSEVTLEVFNILGQKVRTLVNEEQPAGPHRVIWDGRSESGGRVSTGVYFYRLSADDAKTTKKMLLLK